MRLLIADDEMVIRQGLLSLDWQSIGIEAVYAAKDGTEAKNLLARERVDIILSDIRMPGMNGLELAAYIDTHALDIAVVLLTGFAQFEYALEALQHKVCNYLLKPAKPKEILSEVAAVRERLLRKRKEVEIVQAHGHSVDEDEVRRQLRHTFARTRREVNEILGYMANHYRENISLQVLSAHFHFSTGYISRIIKRDTGYSFVDILNAIRLFEGASMLWQKHQRVAAVCEQTGFSSQQYFSALFKRVFGISPLQYRKLPGEERSLQRILDSVAGNR